jgi:hypothetical protein
MRRFDQTGRQFWRGGPVHASYLWRVQMRAEITRPACQAPSKHPERQL